MYLMILNDFQHLCFITSECTESVYPTKSVTSLVSILSTKIFFVPTISGLSGHSAFGNKKYGFQIQFDGKFPEYPPMLPNQQDLL